MKKRYDEDLNEEVEVRNRCPYGFCPMCGLPNNRPHKFNNIWVCGECKKTRFEDVYTMATAFKKLTEE